MVPPIRDARFVDLILAVFMCNSARRQERVCRAQRPAAKIDAIATSVGDSAPWRSSCATQSGARNGFAEPRDWQPKSTLSRPQLATETARPAFEPAEMPANCQLQSFGDHVLDSLLTASQMDGVFGSDSLGESGRDAPQQTDRPQRESSSGQRPLPRRRRSRNSAANRRPLRNTRTFQRQDHCMISSAPNLASDEQAIVIRRSSKPLEQRADPCDLV
jgi:hypothetical protein